MPKMKTKKAAAKRYKVSAKGKVMVASGSRRHLLSNRPQKRKRQLRGTKIAHATKQKLSIALLPYA